MRGIIKHLEAAMNLLKQAWQRLKGGAAPSPPSDLSARYAHFQRLLKANNQTLALMTDMEEKLSGDYLFDLAYIRNSVSELLDEVDALVASLNGLGEDRYQGLTEAAARLGREVEAILNRRREILPGPLVLDFADLDLAQAEAVGGKNANLGEVINKVGLPAPPGFAVATYAYKLFLDYNHLGERITYLLQGWSMADLDSLAKVSDELKAVIQAAQTQPELDAALEIGRASCRERV